MRHLTRSLVLSSLVSVAACSSAPSGDDDTQSTESAVSSCATSPPDGAGGVWLNYPAEAIGCPNDALVNPLVRLPAVYDGSLMQGRIRCGYEWLRANEPEVFQSLGQVTTNETHYFSPDGFDAWYNQFSSGSKVQFEWRGPCGDHGNGYVKFYVVPCSFMASTFSGGILFESPSCGTTVRLTHQLDGSVVVEATSGGARGVGRLVARDGGFTTTLLEGDFHAVQVALAEVQRSQQYGRVSAKPGASVNWTCVIATGVLVGAAGSAVAACIVPEPLEPIACGATVTTAVSAEAGFALACR